MATTLTARTIILINPSNSYDETGIFADTSIQGFANLASGKALIPQYVQYAVWDSVNLVWSHGTAWELTGYVTAANDATIVSGISAFAARWPGYTVLTESATISFGV